MCARLDNSATNSGALYTFAREGTSWSEVAFINASNTAPGDRFGTAVAIASHGKTVVVGAAGESSNTTGLDGNQADNSARGSGAVYVF